MTIVDEEELARHRGPGRCRLCWRFFQRLDPHHVRTRGMGGGFRLDVPENLLAVCRACHDDIGRGVIGRAEVVQAVAQRLRISSAEVERRVNEMLETRR